LAFSEKNPIFILLLQYYFKNQKTNEIKITSKSILFMLKIDLLLVI